MHLQCSKPPKNLTEPSHIQKYACRNSERNSESLFSQSSLLKTFTEIFNETMEERNKLNELEVKIKNIIDIND